VVLHPRTDGEGFLTGLHRELLSPAPLGRCRENPRFLLRRPHLAPAPGGWLVGEAFPLPWPSSRTASSSSFLASGSWRGLIAGNLEEASRIPG